MVGTVEVKKKGLSGGAIALISLLVVSTIVGIGLGVYFIFFDCNKVADKCEKDDDCCDSLKCKDKKCCGDINYKCTKSTECCGSNTCKDKKCSKPKNGSDTESPCLEDEDECNENSECCSENCSNSKCLKTDEKSGDIIKCDVNKCNGSNTTCSCTEKLMYKKYTENTPNGKFDYYCKDGWRTNKTEKYNEVLCNSCEKNRGPNFRDNQRDPYNPTEQMCGLSWIDIDAKKSLDGNCIHNMADRDTIDHKCREQFGSYSKHASQHGSNDFTCSEMTGKDDCTWPADERYLCVVNGGWYYPNGVWAGTDPQNFCKDKDGKPLTSKSQDPGDYETMKGYGFNKSYARCDVPSHCSGV